jgi:ABC-type multidrug transport system ATPase subunit
LARGNLTSGPTARHIRLDAAASAGTAEIMGYGAHAEAAMARAHIGCVPEQLSWGHGWMRVGRLLKHHARYFPS